MGTARARRIGRLSPLVAALTLVAGLGACTRANDDGYGNAPGANTRVGDVLVRYAHLEDPADTDVYPPGSDVPLYVWLSNQSDEPVTLVGASSEASASVGVNTGGLPITLPPGQLLELGRDGRHLELIDTNQQIAGQDLVPVTLTFDPGGSTTVSVEPVEVLPGEAGGE